MQLLYRCENRILTLFSYSIASLDSGMAVPKGQGSLILVVESFLCNLVLLRVLRAS